MDNNFIEVWREAYGKMITDTIKAIALAEEQYVKPYIINMMENPSLLVRFGHFLDKHVSRVSDEQMKEWKKARYNKYIYEIEDNFHYLRLAQRDNPSKAEEIEGFLRFNTVILRMKAGVGISSKQALLSDLKIFFEIYKENPQISDMNAMIQYMARSGTTEHEDLINGISPEIRDNINLNLDENLKAFVEQYAKDYLHEEISLGGMKHG